MAKEKKLDNMTLKEAWEVLEDKAKCGACSKCRSNSQVWDVGDRREVCSTVAEHAYGIVKETFDGMESEYKKVVLTESPETHSSSDSFYSQTRDFMQKSGYTHCYMCGADLEVQHG